MCHCVNLTHQQRIITKIRHNYQSTPKPSTIDPNLGTPECCSIIATVPMIFLARLIYSDLMLEFLWKFANKTTHRGH